MPAVEEGLHWRGMNGNWTPNSQTEHPCPLPDTKLILRPLIGLMSDQPPEEIERHVVLEIEKHRLLRDEAVMLETRIDATFDQETARDASRAYVSAMIAVHAQQTVVSTLLDILGHIPGMPQSKGH